MQSTCLRSAHDAGWFYSPFGLWWCGAWFNIDPMNSIETYAPPILHRNRERPLPLSRSRDWRHIVMTRAQAVEALKDALEDATDTGLLDDLCGWTHPDVINEFCDAVFAWREET